ncbi:MAG: helix-turn-helix transcriptional regulator [Duncaniella sp.]|nr:helix-turn-helix transcriptional regulator [Duncaniella sp.]
MKFNIDRLKNIARPMNTEEKAELDTRDNNREWLAMSEKLALKIRHVLRTEKITQTELASRMGVSSAQVGKILSGKENLGLKTICKIEKALGKTLVNIDIVEKEEHESVSSGMYVQMMTIPLSFTSQIIEGDIQSTNSYLSFNSNKNILA